MSVPAATALALWAAAHAAGASADEALAGISGVGITSGVRLSDPLPDDSVRTRSPLAAIPGPGEPPAGVAVLLPLLRSVTPSLVLPRPGDLRGLPVPGGRLAEAAIRSGAAISFTDAGVTVVPVDGGWRVFAGAGRPVRHDLLVARQELDAAVGRATDVFARAELGVSAVRARRDVAEIVEQNSIRMPAATPARSTALLDRCVQLEALLAVTDRHRTAAVNGYQLDQVAAALAPLSAAARHGRAAAVELAVGTMLADRGSTDGIRIGGDRNG